jgi:hypothetical protein
MSGAIGSDWENELLAFLEADEREETTSDLLERSESD